MGDRSGELRLWWLHTRPDGAVAHADDEGAEWFIGVYAPHTFLVTKGSFHSPSELARG